MSESRHERYLYTANPSAVVDGHEVDALSDGYGRLRVVVDSGTISLNGSTNGQKTMANSSPVVIASDQSAVAIKGTTTARAAFQASAGSPTTLPAAGAYESAPLDAAMIAIPAGSRRAMIYISYTRGAASGQAAHKIYISNGTEVAQCLSIDGTYNGMPGAASVSASAILYSIPVDLIAGETKIGMASAEIGVTATPGTYFATVTFG